MKTASDFDALRLRDGTSRNDRQLPALDPDSIALDERTLRDWLAWAKKFGKRLKYIDENGKAQGDWSNFIPANPESDTDEANEDRDPFIPADASYKREEVTLETVLRWLRDPAAFTGSDRQRHELTRPHFALLLTFLRLLDDARREMNQFTRRHLEFYYERALCLHRNPATPDRVHLLAELTSDATELLIPKDTILLAGKDSQGNLLHYATVDDLVVNRARVDRLASLFVEKRRTGLRETFERYRLQGKDVLRRELLSRTLGYDFFLTQEEKDKQIVDRVGDKDDQERLEVWLKEQDSLLNFISVDLGFRFPALRRLMRLYRKRLQEEIGLNATEWDTRGTEAGPEWERINAHLSGISLAEPRNFLHNAEQWLGWHPMKAANFAPVPGVNNLYDLYQRYLILHSEAPEAGEEFLSTAIQQLQSENKKFWTANDFKEMMRERFFGLDDWQKIVDLIEDAAYRTAGPLPLQTGIALVDYVTDPLHHYLQAAIGVEFPVDLSADKQQQHASLPVLFQAMEDLEAATAMDAESFFRLSRLPVDAPEWQWERVFADLTRAYRQKFPDAGPEGRPESVEWINLYAAEDATAISTIQEEMADPPPYNWKTFGKGFSPEGGYGSFGRLGLSIASPLLTLREGERQIDITFYCQPDGYEQWKKSYEERHYEAFEEGDKLRSLFDISLTTEKDPYQYPATPVITWGVETEAATPETEDLKAWRMRLTLASTVDPILPPADATEPWPVLELRLADLPDEEDVHPDRRYKALEEFRRLIVTEIELAVHVRGLRELSLENDLGTINTKKPFAPFGTDALAGNRFYLTHPELTEKRIDRLAIHFDWKTILADDYYLNYKKLGEEMIKESRDADISVDDYKIPVSIEDSTSFQVATTMRYRNNQVAGEQAHPLFGNRKEVIKPQPVDPDADPTEPADTGAESESPAATDRVATATHLELNADNRLLRNPYNRFDSEGKVAGTVTESSRYLIVELLDPDFQSRIYPQILTRQGQLAARSIAKEIKGQKKFRSIKINPPFVPEVKEISGEYRASQTISLRAEARRPQARVRHLHPFGYIDIAAAPSPGAPGNTLFPRYEAEGHLYIGLAELRPPQVVSLLFQLVEGSGDPDLERPPVIWQYLTGNRWHALSATGGVQLDETQAFLNSGRIILKVPADAGTDHTLLPAGLHWLRAVVPYDSAALCDTLSIRAQALEAEFVDRDNAPDHLASPLPPGSIELPEEPFPDLAAVDQPFASFGGAVAETDAPFRTRVAERLRHKHRALTPWDYERLVLENFPDIYKVKCLPSDVAGGAGEPGRIDIIVIPNIHGIAHRDPFAPKVATDRLLAIQEFLDRHASPWADIRVRNPVYYRITVRLGVRFRSADTDFYRRELERELKKHLSPWAFAEGADIALSREIYPSRVVRFLDALPYVDYVANFGFVLQRPLADGSWETLLISDEEVIRVDRPDVILVSSDRHRIEVFETVYFDPAAVEAGINHMEIELDFRIAPSTKPD